MLRRLLAILLMTVVAASPSCAKDDKVLSIMPDLPVEASAPQRTLARPEEIPQGLTMQQGFTIGLQGIDVSHYQGYIQWPLVARDPQAGYVYIKATESATWVDDTYARNIKEARRAGLKVGAYHFFSPTTAPQEQLANMTSVVKKKDCDLLPMIDVEKVGRAGGANLCHRLATFLKAVEKHYGVRPIIYTGYNFYRKHLAGRFTDYRFMIASYAAERPDFDAIDATVLMWQYSATGTVAGIRGKCDCSAFINGHTLKEIMIKP